MRNHTSEHWPPGAGEMAARIRSHPWAATPLGPVQAWPQGLKAVIEVVLASGFPMVALWGPELVQIYNDGYRRLLGERHPGELGQPASHGWPELWRIDAPIYARVLSGETVTVEDRLLRIERDGAIEDAWFTLACSPLRDPARAVSAGAANGGTAHDAVAGVLVTLVETTARHRADEARQAAEQALRASEARFRQFAEASSDVLWIRDAATMRIEYASDAFEKLYGVSCHAIAHDPDLSRWSAIIEPEDRPRVLAGIQRVLAGESDVHEFRIRRPGDRRLRWVRDTAFPLRDAEGRVERIGGIAQDVTALKRTERRLRDREQRLRDREQRLRTVVDNARDYAIFVLDAQGRVQDWYAGARAVFGWSAEAIGGQPVDLLYVPEDREAGVPARERETASVNGSAPDVRWHLRRDGARVFIEGSCTALRDADGQLAGFLKIGQDVTERRAAAVERETLIAQLREADSRKDEFLAMLAHELRNPLAPIRNAAQLLRLAGRGDTRLVQVAEIVRRQVAHMTALIDDLLDVSRVTRGLIELDCAPVDLDDVVADAIEQTRPLIDTRGHELAIDVPDEPVQVVGDRVRLTQVLANLLSNAAKYTPDGGRITVGVRSDGARRVALSVTDTGVGLAPEFAPHVFELFTQSARSIDRSQGGLGLGLALARGLVELHGGLIEARSPGPGRGSTFTVWLPRGPAAAG